MSTVGNASLLWILWLGVGPALAQQHQAVPRDAGISAPGARTECQHRIDLYDCYGDGWNGNTLDLLVNGVMVQGQMTLPGGTGPWSYYFMAATGDTIETVYHPSGGWPYEPYYYIYDGLGFLLGSDGIQGADCYVQPTGITVTGNCEPPTAGACCYFAGGCALVPDAASCIDGEFLGLGYQCSSCPCYVPCPPGAIPEPEPCGESTDAGCGADPPAFAPIACGDTVCGTLWANTSLRDTDWYELTLDSAQYLTWTVEAQIPVMAAILQAPCGGTMLANAMAAPCQPVSITVEGSAGITYWFWAGSTVWVDLPCDQHYTASLTCSPVPIGACCLMDGTCIEIHPSACTAQSGVYQGDYISCANVVCTPFYCAAGASHCDEYISRVQIGAIDNPSECETGQYADYTNLSANLPMGVATPLVVTNGNPIWTADTCSVWSDWNHDYVFDDFAPEALGDHPGVGPYDFSITPPALLGTTTMRIRIDYANPDPDPCGTTTYGEVEDYTVNVLEILGACCWPDGSCTSELPSTCGGAWAGAYTQCAGADCNANGADDLCDLASGSSTDCDQNGIPDECQPWEDCNDNGIQDFCDIANCADDAWCTDCNDNGIPDGCDIVDCPGPCGTWCSDWQPDLVPDGCQYLPQAIFAYDDSTSEDALALPGPGELCWIAHFATEKPRRIGNVQVCFGNPTQPGSAGVVPGTPFRVFVWDDYNGDGEPDSGALIDEQNAHVHISSIDSGVFQSVPVYAYVSGSFFVGVSVALSGGSPAPMDTDAPVDEAWFAFTSDPPLDPWWLSGIVYNAAASGYLCNWLLRVETPDYDCNGNGLFDYADIGWQWFGCCSGPDCSSDWNYNDIPDECELCGDLDNDANVDLDDYWIFLAAFGSCAGQPNYSAAADIDGDGCVTLVDYQSWRLCYKMANGQDFVAPKPRPMPAPALSR